MFRYLRGTKDFGMQCTKVGTLEIIGYANAGFKLEENSGKSQTGYVFLKNNAPIS